MSVQDNHIEGHRTKTRGYKNYTKSGKETCSLSRNMLKSSPTVCTTLQHFSDGIIKFIKLTNFQTRLSTQDLRKTKLNIFPLFCINLIFPETEPKGLNVVSFISRKLSFF